MPVEYKALKLKFVVTVDWSWKLCAH